MRIRSGLALSLPLAALAFLPPPALADGAWSTYMRLRTCTDMIALTDTVWLASREAGIVRYLRFEDRFESVTREPGGLASNNVTSLAFDRSGQLWAGTPGKGASRLARGSSAWNLVNAFDGLPSDSVNVLRATGDSVWIGTQGGLALWNGKQVAGSVPDLGTPSPFRSNMIRGVVLVHDSLFVGTADGMYVSLLSAGLATWDTMEVGLANRNVFSMATDGHEVFALANGVTYRWSMVTRTWSALTGPGTVRLLRDDHGLMTCSSAGGLWRWTGSAWQLLPGSPIATTASPGEVEFAPDPAGTCFALRADSLRVQGSPWTALALPGPVDNDLQNVIVDGDKVWIASFSEGMARFEANTWRNYDDGCCGKTQDTTFANPSFAFALMRDRDGRKWVSTWGTAVERLDDSVNPPHVDRPIVTLPGSPDSLINHSCLWSTAYDDSNYVYIGGDTFDRGSRPPVGIDIFSPDGTLRAVWTTLNSNIPDNQVRGLALARGRLWAGFPGTGVYWSDSLHPGRSRPPRFTLLPRTGTFDVFGLVARGDSLWVLTTTNLKRFNAASFAEIATLEIPGAPAPRGAVHPLAISPDGTAWVGSVDGVRRYRPGGGFDDYKTSNSPLANDEVRAIAADPVTGVMWFATAGGLNRFDPGYTPPPPPSIPSLSIRVYPNPAENVAIGLDLKLDGNTTGYTGGIYDLNGRLVNRFNATSNGQVVWDGRDLDGQRVRPGVYFVRAHAGGHVASARVVVLR